MSEVTAIQNADTPKVPRNGLVGDIVTGLSLAQHLATTIYEKERSIEAAQLCFVLDAIDERLGQSDKDDDFPIM